MGTLPKSHRQHILTINLEDYFQVGAFRPFVRADQWQRYESRLVTQTERTLELLDQYQARATFFVLGRVAESRPELIHEITRRGHEVASRGYAWQNIRHITPAQFRDDLARGRDAIEAASGQKVLGYRTAEGWFRRQDLWALEVLKEQGYLYDSSVGPVLRNYSSDPWRRFVHQSLTPDGPITELPISSVRILGMDVPMGGNWVRQFPRLLMQRAARSWESRHDAPFVMYFHTWELDPDQPRFGSMGWLTQIRHYRNLHCMRDKVAEYLERFSFDTAAAHLGVSPEAVIPALEPTTVSELDFDLVAPTAPRTPVSVVIPLYNEEAVIAFLANTLEEVRRSFRRAGYDAEFILVDDASRDGTNAAIHNAFREWPDVRCLSHSENRGVAGAIMTGLRAAKTEIVCSMDADCTYDPHELLQMIPKLTDDVDLVTASPYHPHGEVKNVPAWRLVLSKSASKMYRWVFFNQLKTYTSCFRVYRRSRVQDVPIQYGNFLGVVELLGQLDHRGRQIVEHPTTLSVRLLGRSKMKTLRTIVGHLRLMRKFAWQRIRGQAIRPTAVPQSVVVEHTLDFPVVKNRLVVLDPPPRANRKPERIK